MTRANGGWEERRTAAGGELRLPAAVSGSRFEITKRAGRLSYYVAGNGPPLLLLHSINAAASAYEVRPIYEVMKKDRRVYAVDLPGFGFSDRSDREYDVGLYVSAIEDMLDAIAADSGVIRSIDVLSISLTSEFIARAAARAPDRFGRLTFVTPTGFDRRSTERPPGPPGSREIKALSTFLRTPLLGKALFDLLVTRAGIRYFLRKTFGSPHIDEGLAQYDYATAHQPGAQYAPFAFVSGRLFSPDIRNVYAHLEHPIWMPHGTRGDFQDFSGAGWLANRPNWSVEAMPTGALPQFEVPGEFNAKLAAFLGAAGTARDQDSSSSIS